MIEKAKKVSMIVLTTALKMYISENPLAAEQREKLGKLLDDLDKPELWADAESVVKVLQPLLKLHAQLTAVSACGASAAAAQSFLGF